MPSYDLIEKAIILKEGDDVAVAKEVITPEVTLKYDGKNIVPKVNILPGHKIALCDISKGIPVRKYGQIIGFATENIYRGEHVHTHNLEVQELDQSYEYATEIAPDDFYPQEDMRTFMGYKREDGKVGTRNYLAVTSTVNCSSSTSRYICDRFTDEILKDYPNVDGVIPITHKNGCALKIGGEDHRQLQRTLAGFARHPNVAGYIIVGLGCESNQAKDLVESQGLLQIESPQKRYPKIITIQESGGIRKTIENASKAILELLPEADRARRTEQPISKLVLATECGGSDAYSGITANPALGAAADELVRYRGTVILAETPEIYGAEHLLIKRAKNEKVGRKLVERIKWWEHYTSVLGAEINNNPAPGNKEGGITTIYEKSLGAIAKGGTTPLNEVYLYAEQVTQKGFVVMDTPGYDPVSVTGMVAGGANIVTFTTGRGSVFGFKPSPSIKIATNSRLYNHMIDDMDINAGVVLEGVEVQDAGHIILNEIIEVASGKRTKSELNGVGEEEFNPWILGPIL